jgi:acetylornithine deacetylase/succinyl-diaminopimelate desuccinylase-like protein
MRHFLSVLAGVLVVAPFAGHAEPDATALRQAVERWRKASEAAIVRELANLVAIPNVPTDPPNLERNAQAVLALVRRRGFVARLLEEPGAPPTVYGELQSPGATRTIVFYAHYDGQPVDAGQWASPPWTPVLRDGPLDQGGQEIALPPSGGHISDEARLYGRSASDDKSAILALLAALDALHSANVRPSVNVKIWIEGEEEKDSPHLRSFLEHYRAEARGDAWIICDSPIHQSRRMMVVYGARGLVGANLTVYGPTRSLHSGHYGNWAPNPAALLVSLLASMRDPNGRVTINGFGNATRPLTDSEHRAVAQIPSVDEELRSSLGLAHTEADDAPLPARIAMPGLNIRGLSAGRVGDQSVAAIPTEAQASIDFRLVPDQTIEGVMAAVEAHMHLQGYHVVYEAPDAATRLSHAKIVRVDWRPGGYPGFRLSMDLPFSRAVASVVAEFAPGPIVQLPSMGGSVPLYLFDQELHVPVVIVPIANHDNNQHASNENQRMRNLWNGIEVFAGLLARIGPAWGAAARQAPR